MADLLLTVSRLQFAATVIFHMTFPSITVGLSLFLVGMYAAYVRTGREIYLTIYRFLAPDLRRQVRARGCCWDCHHV